MTKTNTGKKPNGLVKYREEQRLKKEARKAHIHKMHERRNEVAAERASKSEK